MKNGEEDENDNEDYYDKEYLDEDPLYETPVDGIDPYAYASGVLGAPEGTLMSSLLSRIPDKMRMGINVALQNKK